MNKLEEAAIWAYRADRKQKSKYQTPDDCWMDWFQKGAEWAQDNQWISVEDSVPSVEFNLKRVIVLIDYNCGELIAIWDNDYKMFIAPFESKEYTQLLTGVSHWMPIPEPPQKKEEA